MSDAAGLTKYKRDKRQISVIIAPPNVRSASPPRQLTMKHNQNKSMSVNSRPFFAFRSAPLAFVGFSVLLVPGLRAESNSHKPVVIQSYHNDVSPALRDMEPRPEQRV